LTDEDAILREHWARARARWPDIELDEADYVAHARGHAGGRADGPTKLHLEDLFLACACARRDEPALRIFEATVLPAADAAVRSLDGGEGFVDEVRQRLRTKLLVGESDQLAKIAEYAGRGALVAWVTVASVRTGLSLLRETKRADKYAGDAWAEILALPDTGDIEVEYLKGRYRQDFAAGFTDACAKLPARDRTILRMHFMDGLNIDQIGQIYGVHRATVARWIAKSRSALFEGTRTYLVQHLALQPAEFSSFDRLVRSQLDVSLGGLFGSDDELAPD
jgi:RNA polymerase sigma-70 factor (ECF subfamily)